LQRHVAAAQRSGAWKQTVAFLKNDAEKITLVLSQLQARDVQKARDKGEALKKLRFILTDPPIGVKIY